MPELLLEVGCEELPATFVRKAVSDLAQKIAARLAELGVGGGEPVAMGTPRRLIVSFPDVLERQPDATKPTRGPALKAAYKDGEPTGALLGFLRGQGADPSQVRDDGTYVWIDKHLPGRPTAELLAEELPAAIRSLAFEKSMRWGSSRMRFARPLRWILALYGGSVVPFEIEGVKSGDASRGHRFYAPEPFSARSLSALLSGLRARKVEPDATRRRAMIEDGARSVSAPGIPDLPEALVEENTYLTEWPTPIQGEFKPDFQGLPEPVLVTAMAKHEKMFPVREEGRLTNRFVFVRNSGTDDAVRSGAEWVLNARFNDAKFFAEGDAQHDLQGFLDKTREILFAERLGTVYDRAARLEKLAEKVARATGADDGEVAFASGAGKYAKADLATGLVSELASLQGIIGGEYARRMGLEEPVAYAIAHQYDPASIGAPTTPETRTGWRLVIADALDKLAGYLGLGLAPTGSSDPYALRRAATQLIEAAWAWPEPLEGYDALLEEALSLYAEAGIDLDPRSARASFHELFTNRYPTLLGEFRHDVLNAAVTDGEAATQPQGVRFRARVLSRLATDNPAFVVTATRPLNLVKSARTKSLEYGVDDPLGKAEHSALESAEGIELLQALSERDAPLSEAVSKEDVDETVRLLLDLEGPINRFLDGAMILVDDPEVRFARLTLLWGASTLLLRGGDFAKLEG